MFIEVIKSKIRHIIKTDTDLNYIVSISLDKKLIDAVNLIKRKKVEIVNINYGKFIKTFVIDCNDVSKEVSINSPAKRKAQINIEKVKSFNSKIVLPNKTTNKLE